MDYTTQTINIKNEITGNVIVNIYHLILSDYKEILKIVDDEIVNIYGLNYGYSLNIIKKSIYNNIKNKSDKQKYGICAEFFMHLFLKTLGYKQKFVFSNLEENSMKKGFDGFYELNKNFWIAESKCAIKANLKHKDKINEALKDIDTKVSNTNGNNPWENAYNHLIISQIGEKNESLSKKVLDLSKDYINNISHKSSEFNLIPTSTLFINNDQKDEDIKSEIEKVLEGRQIKAMIVLCINNDIYNEFINYLQGV